MKNVKPAVWITILGAVLALILKLSNCNDATVKQVTDLYQVASTATQTPDTVYVPVVQTETKVVYKTNTKIVYRYITPDTTGEGTWSEFADENTTNNDGIARCWTPSGYVPCEDLGPTYFVDTLNDGWGQAIIHVAFQGTDVQGWDVEVNPKPCPPTMSDEEINNLVNRPIIFDTKKNSFWAGATAGYSIQQQRPAFGFLAGKGSFGAQAQFTTGSGTTKVDLISLMYLIRF